MGEQVIYLGPGRPFGLPLRTNTIVRGRPEDAFAGLAEAFAAHPDLRALFVPVTVAAAARQALRTPGSALARSYDAVVGCFQGAGQRVVAFWSGVRDWFGGLWQGMTDMARTAWTYMADLGRWAWGGISAVWSGAGAFFSGIVDSITGIFSAFFDWLREKFSFLFSAIDSIGSAVGSVTGAVSDAWSKAFGDDAPKPAAPAAAAVAAKPAAPVAAAAAGKSAAAEVKEPQLATAGAKKGVDDTAYFNKSFNDFMAAEEAAQKKGKSGGGRSGSKSGRAAAGRGPVTVVTLAGDNNRPQTLFIPASARRGASATPVADAAASSASVVTVAALPGRPASSAVLPQTPGRLARRAGSAPTGERGGMQIAVSQKFDILSSDPRAVRKLMDSLKPDFEALVRRALEQLESNRRRTAYAQ